MPSTPRDNRFNTIGGMALHSSQQQLPAYAYFSDQHGPTYMYPLENGQWHSTRTLPQQHYGHCCGRAIVLRWKIVFCGRSYITFQRQIIGGFPWWTTPIQILGANVALPINERHCNTASRTAITQ